MNSLRAARETTAVQRPFGHFSTAPKALTACLTGSSKTVWNWAKKALHTVDW